MAAEPAPSGDEILNNNADNVGCGPVDCQSAGKREGEVGEHHGHHPEHNVVHALLAGVAGGGGDHLLLHPHARPHQEGKDPFRIWLGQVQPEELPPQRHHPLDKGGGVERTREALERLRGGGQRLDDGLV